MVPFTNTSDARRFASKYAEGPASVLVMNTPGRMIVFHVDQYWDGSHISHDVIADATRMIMGQNEKVTL